MPSPRRFPKMWIHFIVRDADRKVIHEGRFRYDDDVQRRAFGERCLDVYEAGHAMETFQEAGNCANHFPAATPP